MTKWENNFIEEDIDLHVFLTLDDDDLKKIGNHYFWIFTIFWFYIYMLTWRYKIIWTKTENDNTNSKNNRWNGTYYSSKRTGLVRKKPVWVSLSECLPDRDQSIRNQEIIQISMIFLYHKLQLSLDDNFFECFTYTMISKIFMVLNIFELM